MLELESNLRVFIWVMLTIINMNLFPSLFSFYLVSFYCYFLLFSFLLLFSCSLYIGLTVNNRIIFSPKLYLVSEPTLYHPPSQPPPPQPPCGLRRPPPVPTPLAASPRPHNLLQQPFRLPSLPPFGPLVMC